MNFLQLHERLRVEMLRRIERGVLTPSMLARQTRFVPAHISNFLNRKRMLSLEALDKVLLAQGLTVADLLDPVAPDLRDSSRLRYYSVPLVANSTAVNHSIIPANLVLDVLKIKTGILKELRQKCSARRRAWERFVAVRIGGEQADSMYPVLPPSATVLIDRHYSSVADYSRGRRSIHAVRYGSLLRFRYVELVRNQLVLRPHNLAYSVELIETSLDQAPGDLLIGRVFQIIVET
jgi:hypothetical protein